MYYRIAIQSGTLPSWRWTSTALSSLNAAVQWLLFYQALPRDRLRVFSSAAREKLDEQLRRENEGLASTSVPAMQLVPANAMTPYASEADIQSADQGGNGARELKERGRLLQSSPTERSAVTFTPSEISLLLALRARCRRDHDELDERELAHLRFLRFLYQTGRLAA